MAGALTVCLLSGLLMGATPSSADETVDEVASAPVVVEATTTKKAKKVALENVGLPQERVAELAYAVGLSKGGDTRGRMGSLYRGKWFMPKKEKIRACIVNRESDNNYKAVSRGGRWRGAYQMNRGLALGSLHQMRPEIRKEMGAAGVAVLDSLRKKPTQTWNRYWQDRAFWTIWRNGSGKSHWSGGAWGCFHHSKAKKAKAAKAEKAAKVKAAKAAKAKKAEKAKKAKAKAKKAKAKKAKARS